jgi:hypothetical protein
MRLALVALAALVARGAAAEPIVLVSDPVQLAELERRGVTLADQLGQARYAAMVRVLGRDIADFARADPQAGVRVAGNPHRLFDRPLAARARRALPARRPHQSHRQAAVHARRLRPHSLHLPARLPQARDRLAAADDRRGRIPQPARLP